MIPVDVIVKTNEEFSRLKDIIGMVNNVNDLVKKWIELAKKDLLTSKQGLEAEIIVTESVCFHAQQTVEKLLKAYLFYPYKFTRFNHFSYFII